MILIHTNFDTAAKKKVFLQLWTFLSPCGMYMENIEKIKMRDVVPCTFRDPLDVKCLSSGAKRIFLFFPPGTD